MGAHHRRAYMCNLGYVNTKVDCNVRRHTRDSSISRHKSDTPRQHKTHTSRSESKATDRRVRTRLKPGEGLPRSQHPPQVPPSPETPAPPHPAAPYAQLCSMFGWARAERRLVGTSRTVDRERRARSGERDETPRPRGSSRDERFLCARRLY